MTAAEARSFGYVVDKEWLNKDGAMTQRPYLVAGVQPPEALLVEGRKKDPSEKILEAGVWRSRDKTFDKPGNREALRLLSLPKGAGRSDGPPRKEGLTFPTYFWFRPRWTPDSPKSNDRMLAVDLEPVLALKHWGTIDRRYLFRIYRALTTFADEQRFLDLLAPTERHADN